MSDQLVYLYGPGSELHVGVRRDGHVLTAEACNTDDLAGARVVAESLDDVPAGIVRCKRCFRVAELQADADSVTG